MAVKIGRVALAGALVLGGGYAVMNMAAGGGGAIEPRPPVVSLSNGQVLVELRGTVATGSATLSWSAGPAGDDTVIDKTHPFYRQVGVFPGDLIVIVIKALKGGAIVEGKITYVGRADQPYRCPGAGSVTCSTIVK